METRRNDNIYLINSYVPEILGSKLPSYRQSFGFFLHLHKVEKHTVRDSSRQAIKGKAIREFWHKASIPIKAEQHCINKLESVFYEWKGLQKHKERLGEAQKRHEQEFVSRLDDLFDIAHQDALSLIQDPEDKAFLHKQRERGRPGCIGGVDKVTKKKTEAAAKRKMAEKKRKQKSKQEMDISFSTVTSSPWSSCDETESRCDDEYKPPATTVVASTSSDAGVSLPKKQKCNVLSSNLMAALDRAQISS